MNSALAISEGAFQRFGSGSRVGGCTFGTPWGIVSAKILKDQEGRFFLDLDPDHFSYILNYLRIVKNLMARKGALRPSRHSNEVRGRFRMYGRDHEVREIWLGDNSDACTADELLEHALPSTTEALYGVLYQAEYFALHHLKSLLSKRLAKGNTVGFLLEDMLEALNSANGTDSARPKTRASRMSTHTN